MYAPEKPFTLLRKQVHIFIIITLWQKVVYAVNCKPSLGIFFRILFLDVMCAQLKRGTTFSKKSLKARVANELKLA